MAVRTPSAADRQTAASRVLCVRSVLYSTLLYFPHSAQNKDKVALVIRVAVAVVEVDRRPGLHEERKKEGLGSRLAEALSAALGGE